MDQAALATFALGAALKATLVFAAAALLLAALRRAPASFRHFAGSLTLAGALALPFLGLAVPSVELALLPAPASVESPAAAFEEAETSSAYEEIETATAPESVARVEHVGYGVAVTAETEPPPPPPVGARIPWTVLGISVWALGAAALLSRLGVGIVRMRRTLATSAPAPAEIVALAREAAESLAMPLRATVHLSDKTRVAITAGLRRPVLVLPTDAMRWSPERTKLVLMHELAHVARRDWAALIATEIALALYWFHPLAWALARQTRRDGERAADDLVLTAGTKPSVYAGHLLAIVRALKADPASEPLPAMGAARPSQFESRLRAMLSGAVSHRAISAGQARVAAVALAAAFLTIAALEPWGKNADAALPRPEGGVELAAFERPQGVVGSVFAEIKEAASSCKSKKAKETAVEPVSAEAAPPAWNEDDPDAAPAEDFEAAEPTGYTYAISPEKETSTGFVQASKNKKKKKGHGDDDAYGRAMSLHRAGDFDEAIALFQVSMDQGYKPAASAYNIACGYALKGEADSAFQWLKKSALMGFEVYPYAKNDDDFDNVRSDPRWRQLSKLSREWEAEGEKVRGEEAARRYADLAANPSTTGEELYDAGMELHKSGRYDAAAKAWQAAAAKGYRPGTSFYNVACAYSLAGNMDGSIQYLRKGVEDGFDNVDAIARGDEDLDAVRTDPRFGEVLRMAKALQLAPWGGKYKGKTFKWDWDGEDGWGESAKEYEAYAHANPQIGRAWFNLGFAKLKIDDARGAIAAFHKALDQGHRRGTTMYNLACAYARDNQKDQAFSWLSKALDAGFNPHGMLRHDDDLDNLRSDPRYREFARRAERLEDSGKHED